MSKFFQLDQEENLSAKLKVVGVGGGGCNAIHSMITKGLIGVEYVAINTDAQVLQNNLAKNKIQIGKNITKGLGAGADPTVGRNAAEEDREILKKTLEGTDMVFVTAGMGGGTGTGASPIVASIAKSLGALVIGIVTKPFKWEGKRRMTNADEGIAALRQYVDSLIVIPNERILSLIDGPLSAISAFDKPNEILYEATRGIADIITIPGLINVDFADVRTVMIEGGEALMGCGIASGENRAVEAAQKAISSPLLEGINIKGAKHILLNVTGSDSLSLEEVSVGNNIIMEAAGEDANIIFGFVRKEEMNEYVSYTVIATGFDKGSKNKNVNQQRENISKIVNTSIGYNNNLLYNPTEEDLDSPTIIRIKTKQDQNKLREDNSDQLDAFNSINVNDDYSEDSSSFLRKMMD
ncbi:MAG: cell division protein FtsZ [Ignavibacteriales bacterium]|nr:cell division protein FtsZ [Ignavibacteriales bacterium]